MTAAWEAWWRKGPRSRWVFLCSGATHEEATNRALDKSRELPNGFGMVVVQAGKDPNNGRAPR
jgi:hypothetical protein